LSVAGDPLERLAQVIDFELFRSDLEAALSRSDRSQASLTLNGPSVAELLHPYDRVPQEGCCSSNARSHSSNNFSQSVPLRGFIRKADQRVREERRLIWRVLRHWKNIADGGRLPRRNEIDLWLQGEDGANCLLIAIGWSIELSHFIVVGVNLAGALCATDSLAGVFLSNVSQVVSSRRGLMMEGVAMLRQVGIRYRAVLLPISETGGTIDYVLGATNYRSLRVNEPRTTQVNFRRLPMARIG
jgi:hypothetical protein